MKLRQIYTLIALTAFLSAAGLNPLAFAGNGIVTEKLTATKVLATSGNVAAGTAAASIPAVAGRLNHITGFSVTSTGSTAAAPVVITVTGMLGGTITFTYATVAGATLANEAFNYEFPHPVPASAINTAIAVSCATLGAGNTNTVTNVFGYVE